MECGIQESKEAYQLERVMLNSMKMWLILYRATGRHAHVSREVARQFARSMTELVTIVGEEQFTTLYPQVIYEMKCLIDKV